VSLLLNGYRKVRAKIQINLSASYDLSIQTLWGNCLMVLILLVNSGNEPENGNLNGCCAKDRNVVWDGGYNERFDLAVHLILNAPPTRRLAC